MNQVGALFSGAFGFINKLTGISLDVLVLVGIFIVLAVCGFYFGKNKLVAFVLAFYPSIFLFQHFPYVDNFTFWRANAEQVNLSHALIFAVFFILCNFLLVKLVHADFGFSKTRRLLEVVILSISAVILIVIFCQHIVPIKLFYGSAGVRGLGGGGEVAALFSSKNGLFWWFLAPIIGVFVTNRYV